jgi:transaldolase/glucose-6-phosphate isomerase
MPTAKQVSASPPGLSYWLGELAPEVEAALDRLARAETARRLWAHDTTLWKPNDAVHQKTIARRLGWLDVTEIMRPLVPELEAFAGRVRAEGFTHALVLGMGGSSLCAEALGRMLGTAAGWLDLAVLDSTHPASVRAAIARSDPARTLYVIASKSGTTAETDAFFSYFYERLRELKGARAGENFVAITDAGTPLEARAVERRVRAVFRNPSDIGGRYSALSYFGLLPAALAGADIRELLDRADLMRHACGPEVPERVNPAFVLGAALAEAALTGRDKVTLVASASVAALGDWVEQLLAESTGKEGKGLIPVVGEPLGAPEAYGGDRFVVHVSVYGESGDDEESFVRALHERGTPVLPLVLADTLDLGGEFFRWEMATAVAGAVLGVDPFNEPNVKESKDNTARLLDKYERAGALPGERWGMEEDGIALYCSEEMWTFLSRKSGDGRTATLAAYLALFFALAREGDYLALLAYLDRTDAIDDGLASLRVTARNHLRLATTLGYGPRYLHSTGQLHKGGPATGLFIQVTEDYKDDVPVPGESYSFAVLNRAQAAGDLRSLYAKGRRAVRLHLSRGAEDSLDAVAAVMNRALDDGQGRG